MKNFKNIINWKLFFILLTACVIGSVLVLPYSLSLTQAEIEASMLLIVLSAVLNNLIMFSIVTFIGLLLSKKIGQEDGGFRLPILEGILERKNQTSQFKAILLPSIGLGAAAGVLIIIFSIPFNKLIPELEQLQVIVSPWKGFLASFYGGIAEEVLLRLFFASLLIWISFKIKKTSDGTPTIPGIWIAIILASVVFGLGHLPVTAQIIPLTGFVVFRAILLNGIGGIVFGWLYWKKGLESAMIAHFSTDIVLHVITPFIVSFFA